MTTVRRVLSGFRGVDFRGQEVSLQRSPDSVNMWRDYTKTDSIHTRPGMVLRQAFSQPVWGIYPYRESLLVHSGKVLYRLDGDQLQVLGTMADGRSQGFAFGNKWYFLDGESYLCYDGTALTPVAGYIPTTTVAKISQESGAIKEDVNLLSDYRINTFLGDGVNVEFSLDTEEIDEDFVPEVTVDGKSETGFTMDYQKGVVKFHQAPGDPEADGMDNISVKFKKHIPGSKEKITRCRLVQVFDNRVFFAGNPEYPNTLWHSSLQDPSYFSDLDYYREGLDDAPITGMAAGNNALWVFRAPGNAGTSVFYHTPVLDADYGKIYPSVHSSVAAGCVGKAVNFLDDMVFFSARGMEGLRGDITTEQAAVHRSTLVDRKLLAEPHYRDMLLEEWAGYLLILIEDKVYLADSRGSFQNEGHREYEFFYWQLEKPVLCTRVVDGVLHLGTEDGLYTLTGQDAHVEAWWTTPVDRFGHPGQLKTLDGRPCVAEAEGKALQIFAKSNADAQWTPVGVFDRVSDGAVFRIKKKKCKDLRLKFFSAKGFGLETVTMEAIVGGPVGRLE